MLNFESVDFVSPVHGREYRIHQGSRIEADSRHLRKIASICNQDDVYKLFKSLKGRVYEDDDARKFLDFIAKGWSEGTHFVFMVTTIEDEVVAALDVKSNDKVMAEIGYWCDQNHRGIMSTAVTIMMAWAKASAYSSLFATPINEKSARLLARVGFSRGESTESEFGRWSCDLSSWELVD